MATNVSNAENDFSNNAAQEAAMFWKLVQQARDLFVVSSPGDTTAQTEDLSSAEVASLNQTVSLSSLNESICHSWKYKVRATLPKSYPELQLRQVSVLPALKGSDPVDPNLFISNRIAIEVNYEFEVKRVRIPDADPSLTAEDELRSFVHFVLQVFMKEQSEIVARFKEMNPTLSEQECMEDLTPIYALEFARKGTVVQQCQIDFGPNWRMANIMVGALREKSLECYFIDPSSFAYVDASKADADAQQFSQYRRYYNDPQTVVRFQDFLVDEVRKQKLAEFEGDNGKQLAPPAFHELLESRVHTLCSRALVTTDVNGEKMTMGLTPLDAALFINSAVDISIACADVQKDEFPLLNYVIKALVANDEIPAGYSVVSHPATEGVYFCSSNSPLPIWAWFFHRPSAMCMLQRYLLLCYGILLTIAASSAEYIDKEIGDEEAPKEATGVSNPPVSASEQESIPVMPSGLEELLGSLEQPVVQKSRPQLTEEDELMDFYRRTVTDTGDTYDEDEADPLERLKMDVVQKTSSLAQPVSAAPAAVPRAQGYDMFSFLQSSEAEGHKSTSTAAPVHTEVVPAPQQVLTGGLISSAENDDEFADVVYKPPSAVPVPPPSALISEPVLKQEVLPVLGLTNSLNAVEKRPRETSELQPRPKGFKVIKKEPLAKQAPTSVLGAPPPPPKQDTPVPPRIPSPPPVVRQTRIPSYMGNVEVEALIAADLAGPAMRRFLSDVYDWSPQFQGYVRTAMGAALVEMKLWLMTFAGTSTPPGLDRPALALSDLVPIESENFPEWWKLTINADETLSKAPYPPVAFPFPEKNSESGSFSTNISLSHGLFYFKTDDGKAMYKHPVTKREYMPTPQSVVWYYAGLGGDAQAAGGLQGAVAKVFTISAKVAWRALNATKTKSLSVIRSAVHCTRDFIKFSVGDTIGSATMPTATTPLLRLLLLFTRVEYVTRFYYTRFWRFHSARMQQLATLGITIAPEEERGLASMAERKNIPEELRTFAVPADDVPLPATDQRWIIEYVEAMVDIENSGQGLVATLKNSEQNASFTEHCVPSMEGLLRWLVDQNCRCRCFDDHVIRLMQLQYPSSVYISAK